MTTDNKKYQIYRHYHQAKIDKNKYLKEKKYYHVIRVEI